MSPPPTAGPARRRPDDFDEVHAPGSEAAPAGAEEASPARRAGRRRARRDRGRRLAVSFGGAAAFEASCSLSSLPAPSGVEVPAQNGLPLGNSFVYAANGSLLGSIPAEKNRQPVALAQISPWMPKATVAIEDRRFYKHGGVDYKGIVRAAVNDLARRQGRPGRLDDHTAARPQPLHLAPADLQAQAQGGVPRDQAAAEQVEGLDPRHAT